MQVFDAKDWEALMTRSILPKLAWALSEALVINPSDQDLTAWNWVVAWSPVMPVQAISSPCTCRAERQSSAFTSTMFCMIPSLLQFV